MVKKTNAKVITLPARYFTKNTRPLSSLMIQTLLKACKRQTKGIRFGQADLDGSFSSLVSRGFLKYSEKHATWVVTNEALEILHGLGIKVSCFSHTGSH